MILLMCPIFHQMEGARVYKADQAAVEEVKTDGECLVGIRLSGRTSSFRTFPTHPQRIQVN